MKKWMCILIVGVVMPIGMEMGCGTIQTDSEAEFAISSQGDGVLDAYGQWINVDPYGQVWQPRVGSRWAPFTEGQWVDSDQGWIWDSNEPYGWLVYHYGSWDYRENVGWYWVPADTWYPATVQWVDYGDYVGWAPLPPPGVSRSGPWVHGQERFWTVVSVKQFNAPNVGKRRVSRRMDQMSGDRDSQANMPPDRSVVERLTKKKVEQVTVQRQPVTVKSQPRERVVLHRISGSNKNSRSKSEQNPRPEKMRDRSDEHRRGDQESATDTSKVDQPRR